MPIKPENKHLYPENWKEIAASILTRAKNKCENCGIPNHAVGYRDESGRFVRCGGNLIVDDYGFGIDPNTGKMLDYKKAKEWADFETLNDEMGNKYIVIVLTVSHQDHNPRNNNPDNLKALCQQCHNRHDIEHRKCTRKGQKYYGMNSLF